LAERSKVIGGGIEEGVGAGAVVGGAATVNRLLIGLAKKKFF
jgi:hypothetical protein